MMNRAYQPGRRRRSRFVWLIPFVILGCLGLVLIVPALPGLLLQVIGFTPRGTVEEFWNQTVASTPVAIVGLPQAPAQPAEQPAAITPIPLQDVVADDGSLNTWFQSSAVPSSITISSQGNSVALTVEQAAANSVLVGQGVDGFPLAVVEYQETALDVVCANLLRGCQNEQFRVDSVDFRPGGMIVYGSASVSGLNQSLGAIVGLTADAKQFEAQGIVLNGQVFAVPSQGDIANYVNDVIGRANSGLSQLGLQAGGYTLSLVQIQITDSSLTAVFR